MWTEDVFQTYHPVHDDRQEFKCKCYFMEVSIKTINIEICIEVSCMVSFLKLKYQGFAFAKNIGSINDKFVSKFEKQVLPYFLPLSFPQFSLNI